MSVLKQIQQFKDSDRFLPISVYKFPLGNCGGVTDFEKSIYIPCESGFIQFSKMTEKEKNLIFIPEKRGNEYWALNPLFQPTGVVGPMSGGNLAYSSDSRCERVYHIHDRFETQSTYNAMSR